MSEALNGLFFTSNVKEFAKQFKALEKEWEEPSTFLRQAAEFLAPRLYERHYDLSVPHSYFGLGAAASMGGLCPEDRKWWPYVQQAWFAAGEQKRSPWDFSQLQAERTGSLQELGQRLEEAIADSDYKTAFSLSQGSWDSKEERSHLRSRLLSAARSDTALGGHKYLYLSQCWTLLDNLPGEPAPELLFPALHLLITGPRDETLSEAVNSAERAGVFSSIESNTGRLDEKTYSTLEAGLLLSDDLVEALKTVERAAASGATLESLWDGVLLAASTAVANSKAGAWVRPVRAYLFTYMNHLESPGQEPKDQVKTLLTAAALVHRGAVKSRFATHNRDLEEVSRQLCPTDTFNTLRSVVSHSDPVASATCVYTILGMGEEKVDELFQNLATLAAKNDGRMGRGYDLLLVKAASDCYRQSELPGKAGFAASCGYFLGRIQKSYELFGAYGTS